MMNTIENRLDLARRELLDMGLRANPLLNFRPGTKSLSIIDELSDAVFDILISQKKLMRFLPVPEVYEEEQAKASLPIDDTDTVQDKLPPLAEYLEEQGGEGRHNDTCLQTSLSSEKLDTTLLRLENEAHTLLQEQGIEVLYLALGFLKWYEDPNSSTPRLAPLILVPVELRRGSAKDTFSIAWTEADAGSNLALAAKLKGEFRVELPDIDDDADIPAYLENVREAVSKQSRWEVKENDMALGLFSFGKFQMYTDLAPEHWPEDKSPANHQIVKSLFSGGFSSDAERVSNVENHQYVKEPESLQLVKDADSSQTAAILSAIEGANLVIQGPPGTGKSQTITNIISEGLARGKKILFVAQKMAALSVVKQRLDESCLGDAVLELHSHKSTKKAVLDSLQTTLDQGKPQTPCREDEYDRLRNVRTQLNNYVEATKKPILNSEENYIQALGKQLRVRAHQQSAVLPELPFQIMNSWDRETLATANRIVASMVAHIEEKGLAVDNPFSDSKRTSLSPVEQHQIATLASACITALNTITEYSRKLAADMALPVATTLAQVEVLHRAATRAVDAPKLEGIQLNTDDWQQRRDAIRKLVKAGTLMQGVKRKHQERFIPQAWGADVLHIRQGLAGRADKWWRIFSGEYRRAKAAYQGLCKGDLEGAATDWLNHIDDLLIYQNERRTYESLKRLGETLFQAQWQQEDSDWEVLETISSWLIHLYEEIGKGDIPEGITQFLQGQGGRSLADWQPQLDQLTRNVGELTSHIHQLMEKIDVKAGHPLNECLTINFLEMDTFLTGWQQAEKLYDIARFNQLCEELEVLDLGDLAHWSADWSHTPQDLLHTLNNSYYSGLVNEAYNSHAEIRQFDRLTHERLLKEFSDIDSSLFDYAKESLTRKIYDSLPNKNAPGEMDIVRREMNKKRRHLAIRRLMSEAGSVIQQIKPVFMMSPMSVATYLPQGRIEFDMVVFDEASQITAPDALGAIARAKQVIVVGDSKQMPPTNFFGRAVELDENEADQSATADVESILGLMSSKGAPESMLRWHYRSRHHSLIAVSNAEFYNNKLMVFPSPGIHPSATGLKMNLLDTTYDRGGSRTNKMEALAIAEAVMEHARHKGHLSLGVVAFSTAQRDAIILEVERLRREYSDVEEFFERQEGDEFFIKNLENVQGDERDVIYISVGYGRTTAGNVSQNFGPLNKVGGERRLNVLITRARMAMEVFCNFTADDLKTNADSPLGIQSFKAFLKYAETGELEQSRETGKGADSPFEEDVHRAIENLGYQVEPQVGCNGFYIDLAVRDPEKPGRYILAVECDGATYHSSASARDRDRIRQSVLEGLGWRFHRIWSTDWFRNASGEITRLQESIEQSVAYYKTLELEPEVVKTTVQPAQTKVEIVRAEAPGKMHTGLPPYQQLDATELSLAGWDSFEKIESDKIESAIEKIVAAEGPVHSHILATRLTHAAGFSKVGVRIRRKIDHHLSLLGKRGHIIISDEFVSSTVISKPVLRDWSFLDNKLKKLEYVSDDELREVVTLTVKDAHSITSGDCIAAALSLIGFKRVTTSARERGEAIIEQLINDGTLKQRNDRFQLAD
ncbi:DUF3320 domain-containing protein [Sansalvadorimonas verongulae]|uniref:DUF3320 domain-containing protein n=1 Tax=Sansalvadorimonas verongulae TaxID=2172824 RepID=UPI0018AD1B4E|nr:DUF3320 domain-containing protein [Sansalvadorimonas verongulae]